MFRVTISKPVYFSAYKTDYYMHHIHKRSASIPFKPKNPRELEAQYWIANAQKTVASQLLKFPTESKQHSVPYRRFRILYFSLFHYIESVFRCSIKRDSIYWRRHVDTNNNSI